MSHKVFLNSKGFLEQAYIGDQTGEAIAQAINEANALIEQLRSKQQPVLILVDSSQLGKLSTPTRKASMEAFRNASYDKVAIYGLEALSKAIISLIIHASGKQSKVRMFASRKAAEAWLEK